MNTGQMLLSLGGMVLLGFLVLRVNSTFLNTNQILYDTKFDILAGSLSTSMIEEIKSKAFDQNTDAASVGALSALSTTMGPESGETIDTYNDIDDYNNYVRVVNNVPSAIYSIKCNVGYINPASPDVITTAKNWHKKITVSVYSPSMRDTIRTTTIFSYWVFN